MPSQSQHCAALARLLRSGKIEQAIERGTQVLEEFPESASIHHRVGLAFLRRAETTAGALAKAQACAEHAAEREAAAASGIEGDELTVANIERFVSEEFWEFRRSSWDEIARDKVAAAGHWLAQYVLVSRANSASRDTRVTAATNTFSAFFEQDDARRLRSRLQYERQDGNQPRLHDHAVSLVASAEDAGDDSMHPALLRDAVTLLTTSAFMRNALRIGRGPGRLAVSSSPSWPPLQSSVPARYQ